jgi:hypothetical protein
LKNILTSLIENGRRVDGGNYSKPTDEDIKAFYDRSLDSYEKTMYVGTYLAIVYILDHEGKDEGANYYLKRLLSFIVIGRKKGEVFDDIMERAAKLMNFDERSDACSSWVIHAYNCGGEKIKALLNELAKTHKYVAQSLEKLNLMNKPQENSVRFAHYVTREDQPTRMVIEDEPRLEEPVIAPAGYVYDDRDELPAEWQ